MKPLIGIVSLYDEFKESLWMLPGYVRGLEAAGAAVVILPLTEGKEALSKYAALCDGFLFPGGHDLAPELYGEQKSELCGTVCPERDNMERLFFPMVLETGKPFLGICRGVQLINALLGGTLYQDLPAQHESEVNHHETPPYDKPAHLIRIEKDSPLYAAVEQEEMWVNSYHHQGVKTLGKGLEIAAAASDGIVEALYLPGHRFALGVQWHPEFSYESDENSRKIFAAFVNACSGK